MADASITDAERARLIDSARRYLRQHKAWRDDEFRVDIRALSDEGNDVVLWGIFLDDERHPAPGGGRSVELHADRSTAEITRELAFQ